jgi:hypothetical protein
MPHLYSEGRALLEKLMESCWLPTFQIMLDNRPTYSSLLKSHSSSRCVTPSTHPTFHSSHLQLMATPTGFPEKQVDQVTHLLTTAFAIFSAAGPHPLLPSAVAEATAPSHFATCWPCPLLPGSHVSLATQGLHSHNSFSLLQPQFLSLVGHLHGF